MANCFVQKRRTFPAKSDDSVSSSGPLPHHPSRRHATHLYADPREGSSPVAPATLTRRWTSIDELQAAAKNLPLDLLPIQLEKGPFGGQILSLAIPPLRLVRFQVAGRVHSLGQRPKGVLSMSLDLDPRIGGDLWRSHGQLLPSDCLFGLAANREIHITLPAHITLGMVFVPFGALGQWADQLGWPGFNGELLPPSNVRLMETHSAIGLRSYLRQLFATAEASPHQLGPPASQQLILADLMPLLLEALISGSSPSRRTPARIEIVKEVQLWMHDHPTQPITMAELCRQAHASRRTLIQGFRDHLGLGPMGYLKLLRLHGIRQHLLQAEPSAVEIGTIAGEWGFFNPGHFAADYRRLFGERPRDTLRRAADASTQAPILTP